VVRWSVIGVVAAAALLSRPGLAVADPAAPQPGTPCESSLVDAMTWPSDVKIPLVCAGTQWQPVTTPYPMSDRWFSYGPAMKLHGQGLRNPNILSGAWVATPLNDETACRAEQLAVIPGTPQVGPPRVDQGDAGRPLTLEVVPVLFSIEMSGDCLWQKTDPDPDSSGR
jgi:hypothetical protein